MLKRIFLASFLLAPAFGYAKVKGVYFTVKQSSDTRWDLVDSKGKPFFSTGVCVVQPKDEAVKPGAQGYDVTGKRNNLKDWARATTKRLKSWGFNTIGSWSHESLYRGGLAFTHSLALCGYDKPGDRLVDVWSPEWESKIREAARKGCEPFRGNTRLIGYFLDNELPWYGDTGWPGPQNTPLLDKYLALEPLSPGHIMAVESLRKMFESDASLKEISNGEIRSFGSLEKKSLSPGQVEWPAAARDAFLGEVAERYFSLAQAAIRAVDADHMILGSRFAGQTPRPVIVAAGKYCDVISLNHYSKGGQFDETLFDTVYALAKKPILLTEFSYRAMENRSGDKNSKGADVTVATQKERAVRLQTFLGGALKLGYVLGYHWFQYFDESPQGRSFDDEDSNYGLVDINDRPYEPLIKAFKKMNARAATVHKKVKRALPSEAPQAVQIKVRRSLGADTSASLKAFEMDYADKHFGDAYIWNESSAKGSKEKAGKALLLVFDSGKDWGLGLGLSLMPATHSDGSRDLMGLGELEIEVEAPKGLKFQILFNESATAEPGKSEYKGAAGSDGESYASPTLIGTGKRSTYRVNPDFLEARPYWGNQQGNKIIDLQAIKNIDLAIGGQQGAGQLKLFRVSFKP